ncbi:MAG: hypothetical protein M1813_000693 [Trichoglossum hirsutum]|nr:MAG: hypothetical protein M1813_000693 [Trichoglossum hirsutum]
MSASHILVAGSIPIDLLVYPSPNPGSSQRGEQKLRVHRSSGGAALIADLLLAAADQHEHQTHKPAFAVPKDTFLEHSASAITELDVFGEAVEGPLSFKVRRRQKLDTKPVWHSPLTQLRANDDLSVLIFQDAEQGFNKSDVATAVDLFRESHPRILLYHMALPLGTGLLWDAVRRGPYGENGKQDPEKLIVVVSADDLRSEGIELCHGLSWERTCEDFVEKLGSNGKLDTLVTCAHLIVLFGCDGIIYHRGRQMVEPTLFFDPFNTEGRFIRRNIGYLPGLTEAFIGGLATKIAQSPETDLDEGIKFGFSAARRLAKLGFRNDHIHQWPRYPSVDIMQNLTSDEDLITLSIPSESISRGDTSYWSILHHNIGDPVQIAHSIVKEGTYSAANWIPVAQFGRLVVLDRSEIEAFRSIFNAIREYLSSPQTKPLNIGIFGSRGSGKSFAAMQVATAAAFASSQETRYLRFNLSQFTSPEDLLFALNIVRDCTLSGTLPLVYINAFDIELSGQPLGWLTHLLPPMHGGQVLDHGEMRHIGRAIFLLGSSTTTSFKGFQGFLEDKDILSAQEFLSCLHGFVNVLGFDQVDEFDALYPVRRAVVLRELLEEREPLLQTAKGISIDESILDGLLMIPTYRHGLRSLKSIIAMSQVTGKRHFERAALPPEAQLALHLDYQSFMKYSQFDTLPEDIRETVSERLHETYVNYRKSMAKNDHELKELEKQTSANSWASLSEEYKESARAHAVDIPRKLRMIFCFLAKEDESRHAVIDLKKEEIDLLAEKEHERWNAERLQKQWHLGQRSEENRTNPFLIPWRDLEKRWQDVDRAMVESYIKILPDDYKIYRIGSVTKMKLKGNAALPTRSTI